MKFSYGPDVATAAHDLRNRLSIACCEIHQLRRRVPADGRIRPGVSECLASIERSLAHTNKLMEDLLELATNEAVDQTSTGRQTADLVACATWVVALERCASAAHHLMLEAAIPTLVGAWKESQIARMLHNLVSNAVKYSPAGSTVLVTLDKVGDGAVVRVADRGIGIPVEDLPRIFEPFYRARNAERTASGLGLGLASARMIVEQNGGLIQVESTEGIGTVFTVRLPLAPD